MLVERVVPIVIVVVHRVPAVIAVVRLLQSVQPVRHPAAQADKSACLVIMFPLVPAENRAKEIAPHLDVQAANRASLHARRARRAPAVQVVALRPLRALFRAFKYIMLGHRLLVHQAIHKLVVSNDFRQPPAPLRKDRRLVATVFIGRTSVIVLLIQRLFYVVKPNERNRLSPRKSRGEAKNHHSPFLFFLESNLSAMALCPAVHNSPYPRSFLQV